jgi:hypothetical protein
MDVNVRRAPADFTGEASLKMVGRERLEQVLWGEDPPDRDMLRSRIYELRTAVDCSFAEKLTFTIPKQGYGIRATATPGVNSLRPDRLAWHDARYWIWKVPGSLDCSPIMQPRTTAAHLISRSRE